MKLQVFTNIESLRFDIVERRLDVYHTSGYDNIFAALDSLGLDTQFISSKQDYLALSNLDSQRGLIFSLLNIKRPSLGDSILIEVNETHTCLPLHILIRNLRFK